MQVLSAKYSVVCPPSHKPLGLFWSMVGIDVSNQKKSIVELPPGAALAVPKSFAMYCKLWLLAQAAQSIAKSVITGTLCSVLTIQKVCVSGHSLSFLI